ncbi:DUF211 domain-containing protein [Halomicrococcus gelatinilyticus]|uniref:DUF211 domain-containing protein n=1 Tax=Halomicrococcus gelatinilyticus TaxID=1702103 RepID=UPI002E11F3D1
MAPLRRVVVDVLTPHEPTMLEIASEVADSESVTAVDVTLLESDREVRNVKLTVEGEAIRLDDVEDTVEDLGGTVHSVDQVACGEYVVEERTVPQE